MAVYTHVSEDALKDFLNRYDVGTLTGYEGISEGVENSNYHVFTDKGRYILTLYEQRVSEVDLPFFFAFMNFLSGRGILCPHVLRDQSGADLGRLADRPAALVSFLEGKGVRPEAITPDHCAQLGQTLARMHRAAQHFPGARTNTAGFDLWESLAKRTASRADEVETGLAERIRLELAFLKDRLTDDLPSAVIHADVFPDNVFFRDGELYGFIDFYFSCTGALIYDLALVVNAWCFDGQDALCKDRLSALLSGYQGERSLMDSERRAFQAQCRAAAIRILSTRLHDWLFRPEDALVCPKDPKEYLRKLAFHQEHDIAAMV